MIRYFYFKQIAHSIELQSKPLIYLVSNTVTTYSVITILLSITAKLQENI